MFAVIVSVKLCRSSSKLARGSESFRFMQQFFSLHEECRLNAGQREMALPFLKAVFELLFLLFPFENSASTACDFRICNLES